MPLRTIANIGLCTLLCSWAVSTSAQGKWLLPTDIQSTAEKEAPKTRAGWALPAVSPIKLGASGQRSIVPIPRSQQNLFTYGSVVTTGFSGTQQRMPRWAADAPKPNLEDLKYSFIDLNGPSATLMGMSGIGFAMNGSELTRLPYDRILARDVGQVFGLAIDNEEHRNLYLAATSAYGLNITAPDENNDGIDERLYVGAKNAGWMKGQWGPDIDAGPGSIWKVDGQTGQISLFANTSFEGIENAGPGLGNIVFDALHDQLFVSDLQSGMIHRFDLSGVQQGLFDHAIAIGQGTPFDPSGVMDHMSDSFDVEDASTWGFAPKNRRVWGMAVQGGRLYYALADGPSVYSVGLDRATGAFLSDPQLEFKLPRAFGRAEISDMVFAGDGALLLAQRGARLGSFDHLLMTRPKQGAVLRFVQVRNPDTNLLEWTQTPEKMPVGFDPRAQQGTGGIAVGPAYDLEGAWMDAHCGGTLWSTGEMLRANPAMQPALDAGGAALVDGVQAQSAVLPLTGNAPPWQSYFVDYDRRYESKDRSGHMGDVEVAGCRGAGGLPEHFTNESGSGNTGTPTGGDCNTHPWLCPPPKPDCMGVTGEAICNPQTGEYELVATVGDSLGFGIDRFKASDPANVLTGLPADNPTSLQLIERLKGFAAGQTAQVNICGYSSALKATGAPFPCCNATLVVRVPDAACEKEAN